MSDDTTNLDRLRAIEIVSGSFDPHGLTPTGMIAATLDAINNSPEALKAMGLCKIGEGLPWHQGYRDGWDDAIEWNNEDDHYRAEEARIAGVLRKDVEKLEAENASLREQLEESNRKLKEVREMRDELLPWASDAQFSETNGTETRTAIRDLIGRAEAQVAAEKGENQ